MKKKKKKNTKIILKNPGRLNSNDLVWFGFIYQQKTIISGFIILVFDWWGIHP